MAWAQKCAAWTASLTPLQKGFPVRNARVQLRFAVFLPSDARFSNGFLVLVTHLKSIRFP